MIQLFVRCPLATGAGCTYGVVQLCKGFISYGNLEVVGDIGSDVTADFNVSGQVNNRL